MTIHYRGRANNARTGVSFKLTEAQIKFLDTALNPNETRSQFIEKCVLTRARYRLRKKNNSNLSDKS